MLKIKSTRCFFISLLFLFVNLTVYAYNANLPADFVYLEEIVPDAVIELRYYTKDNFVGARINGYLKPRCIITRQAAEALNGVASELGKFGLGLKIYDAYRPTQAVAHFVKWAKDLEDTRMKALYYPDVAKKDLFTKGYIAEKSSHSRGSTVDLTIISLYGNREELDMGSSFDFFGPASWPDNKKISGSQRSHRMLLQTLMIKHGFKSLKEEWWHFILEDEPYPDTYFNFPVQ